MTTEVMPNTNMAAPVAPAPVPEAVVAVAPIAPVTATTAPAVATAAPVVPMTSVPGVALEAIEPAAGPVAPAVRLANLTEFRAAAMDDSVFSGLRRTSVGLTDRLEGSTFERPVFELPQPMNALVAELANTTSSLVTLSNGDDVLGFSTSRQLIRFDNGAATFSGADPASFTVVGGPSLVNLPDGGFRLDGLTANLGDGLNYFVPFYRLDFSGTQTYELANVTINGGNTISDDDLDILGGDILRWDHFGLSNPALDASRAYLTNFTFNAGDGEDVFAAMVFGGGVNTLNMGAQQDSVELVTSTRDAGTVNVNLGSGNDYVSLHNNLDSAGRGALADYHIDGGTGIDQLQLYNFSTFGSASIDLGDYGSISNIEYFAIAPNNHLVLDIADLLELNGNNDLNFLFQGMGAAQIVIDGTVTQGATTVDSHTGETIGYFSVDGQPGLTFGVMIANGSFNGVDINGIMYYL